MSIRVAVIGAGVSGLACAARLAATGVSVRIFDKSHAPSGRCATRQWRWSPAVNDRGATASPANPPAQVSPARDVDAEEVIPVDHGAPFFTCPSPCFRAAIDRLAATGAADVRSLPSAAVVDADGTVVPPPPGGRRYVAGGNRRLGEALAAAAVAAGDVTTMYGTRIEDEAVMTDVDDCAGVVGGVGSGLPDGPYTAVVVTPPGPQAAALLGLPPSAGVPYATTLTVVLAVAGAPPADAERVFLRRTPAHPLLTFSTCEAVKGAIESPATAGGGATTVYVGHAGGLPGAAPVAAAWADSHFDSPTDAWAPALVAAVADVWGLGSAPRVAATFSHRWRYARAVTVAEAGAGLTGKGEGPFRVAGRWGVYVCGDGVGTGGATNGEQDVWAAAEAAIDSAYMSGVGCADAVLEDAAGLRGWGGR
nr:PhM00075.1 [Neoporphyra haitanensis]WOE55312.1 PhF00075.1 [Neoporphyra haitanensis]